MPRRLRQRGLSRPEQTRSSSSSRPVLSCARCGGVDILRRCVPQGSPTRRRRLYRIPRTSTSRNIPPSPGASSRLYDLHGLVRSFVLIGRGLGCSGLNRRVRTGGARLVPELNQIARQTTARGHQCLERLPGLRTAPDAGERQASPGPAAAVSTRDGPRQAVRTPTAPGRGPAHRMRAMPPATATSRTSRPCRRDRATSNADSQDRHRHPEVVQHPQRVTVYGARAPSRPPREDGVGVRQASRRAGARPRGRGWRPAGAAGRRAGASAGRRPATTRAPCWPHRQRACPPPSARRGPAARSRSRRR